MVTLSRGASVPALGQGTWYLGDAAAIYEREVEALRAGIEAGMTLLDTAENYGDGRSERLVGEAIRPYDRSSIFLVLKVMPSNAYGTRLMQSLDRSLSHLGTDYLYLYHWRGERPLAEMVTAMEEARAAGKIRAWGVSNLDTADMEELWAVDGGRNCAVNQVLYHMGSRGIDYSFLPWMRERPDGILPARAGGTARLRSPRERRPRGDCGEVRCDSGADRTCMGNPRRQHNRHSAHGPQGACRQQRGRGCV